MWGKMEIPARLSLQLHVQFYRWFIQNQIVVVNWKALNLDFNRVENLWGRLDSKKYTLIEVNFQCFKTSSVNFFLKTFVLIFSKQEFIRCASCFNSYVHICNRKKIKKVKSVKGIIVISQNNKIYQKYYLWKC